MITQISYECNINILQQLGVITSYFINLLTIFLYFIRNLIQINSVEKPYKEPQSSAVNLRN